MFNWTEICSKYRAAQLAGDNNAMLAILNQIKTHYSLGHNATALAMINERCERFYPKFIWSLPEIPIVSYVDCYDCNQQIMNRFPSGTPCPEGWIASPVSATYNTSNNPCNPRNTHTPTTPTQWQPISFYNTNTGNAIGDPVLQRGGNMNNAVNKKIGNFTPVQKAGKYQRTRGMNTSMLTKGYPINSSGIRSQGAGLANPDINPNMRITRKRVNRTMPKKNWLQRLFS